MGFELTWVGFERRDLAQPTLAQWIATLPDEERFCIGTAEIIRHHRLPIGDLVSIYRNGRREGLGVRAITQTDGDTILPRVRHFFWQMGMPGAVAMYQMYADNPDPHPVRM